MIKSVPLILFLLIPPALAQTSDSTTLNISFAAGLLSISNLGSAQHAFAPISTQALQTFPVPLSLNSAPTFQITNLGNTAGWSVVLSAQPGSQTPYELEYQPGDGRVRRLIGVSFPQDLEGEVDFGGKLSSGRKVLSAPANSNQGLFVYTLSNNQWSLLSPAGEVHSGQFNWTLQATLYANP